MAGLQKTPAALPTANHQFNKKSQPDFEWFLRHNDRGKLRDENQFPYYDPNPIAKKSFRRIALADDHFTRVFDDMARHRNRSEGSLVALRTDPEAQREMARRYSQVMRTGPAPPAAAATSFRAPSAPGLGALRQRPRAPQAPPLDAPGSTGNRRGQNDALGYLPADPSPPPPAASAPPPPDGGGSRGGAASALSAAAPFSMLSAATAPSMLSAAAPTSMLSAAMGSELTESSVSDFYSWRPRLIM